MNKRKNNRFYILNVGISAIDMDDACSVIEEAISRRQKRYICVCPVSTIMECKKNEKMLKSVNSADLATPDGMAVVWLGWMQGYKNIRRVYGPELMEKVCAISAKNGYKNYFYGSTQDVLGKLKERLIKRYPGLIISGMFSPPFRQSSSDEDNTIVEEININAPDIIWVALGSPKQDLWMYEHRDRLNAPVMIGVGAAFDFLAGTKPQAPRWIRGSGFEWLFRLLTEPKRLWRRYLVNNSLFIYYVTKECFLKKFRPQKLPQKIN